MELDTLINIVYMLSALTFIVGLKLMSNPETARQGNLISGAGMLAAVVVTAMDMHIGRFDFILVGLVAGTVAGLRLVQKTAADSVAQTLSLFTGFGGLASILVALAEYYAHPEGTGFSGGWMLWLTVVFGALAFSGALMVWAKRQKKWVLPKSVPDAGLKRMNLLLSGAILVFGLLFSIDPVSPQAWFFFLAFLLLAIFLGVRLAGAVRETDPFILLALLNGYAGMAACASGFVVRNNLLVIAGALAAAAAISLALQMCRTTQRSIRDFYPFS